MDIATRLGYKSTRRRREVYASGSGESPRIGIVVCQSQEEELNDPYFYSIRQGIESECFERGAFITKFIQLSKDPLESACRRCRRLNRHRKDQLCRFAAVHGRAQQRRVHQPYRQ
nr:hypothetical protein [Bacillus licheniformis]